MMPMPNQKLSRYQHIAAWQCIFDGLMAADLKGLPTDSTPGGVAPTAEDPALRKLLGVLNAPVADAAFMALKEGQFL